MTETELLASIPLFSELSSEAINDLLSLTMKKGYRKNNMILMEEEFGDTLFIIVKGSVKITRVNEEGKEVILSILGEGGFFGEMSLLDGETRSANAIALDDSEVLILKRRDFLSIIEKNPRFAISLLVELAQRIRKSDQQIESLSLSDAESRVGKTLLRLADELGTIRKGIVEIINLPYQQDIANMAGTSRETVSRMLRVLEDKKLIVRKGHAISIIDYTRFRKTFG